MGAGCGGGKRKVKREKSKRVCADCGKGFEPNSERSNTRSCPACRQKRTDEWFRRHYLENRDSICARSSARLKHLRKIAVWYRDVGHDLVMVLPAILEYVLPVAVREEEDIKEIMKLLREAPREAWYENSHENRNKGAKNP